MGLHSSPMGWDEHSCFCLRLRTSSSSLDPRFRGDDDSTKPGAQACPGQIVT
ncbi:hypothetical protein [Lysobacter gummosus]|uniref:hypothetical protein n=1 Tax=Lysobacter gummosus TaxID=262324 RepID=UPI00362D3023